LGYLRRWNIPGEAGFSHWLEIAKGGKLLTTLPLEEGHLEEAARLVSSRYEVLCRHEPLLPQSYKEVPTLLPLLNRIFNVGGPGVASFQDGRMVGFLTAWLMPGFRGKKSVYSPEWANGALLTNSRYIYEEMYSKIAAEWVAEQYLSHYISLFANDLGALEGWHWLGFGMLGVDAVRGLSPVAVGDIDVDVQLAGVQHIEHILALNQGLRVYAKESPYFFINQIRDRDYFSVWLADPNKEIWLALIDDEPAGFLHLGPANDDVATIIYDEKTTSIYGAFTVEDQRGRGIGAALLRHAVESARSAGYLRCAVDFESMNIGGARYWFKQGFKPVSLSLHRLVDERLISGS
jgi:GNAT superfamily N-acetyltransferase